MKFLKFGELHHNVDENGVPGTIIRAGDDMPADYPQESVNWLALNGYTFDPMPETTVPGATSTKPQQPQSGD